MQIEQKVGMVIVDHGSRFAAANDMLVDVADMFKRVSGYAIVEPAHMELAEPSIPQAIAACVRQRNSGHRAPLFFIAGAAQHHRHPAYYSGSCGRASRRNVSCNRTLGG